MKAEDYHRLNVTMVKYVKDMIRAKKIPLKPRREPLLPYPHVTMNISFFEKRKKWYPTVHLSDSARDIAKLVYEPGSVTNCKVTWLYNLSDLKKQIDQIIDEVVRQIAEILKRQTDYRQFTTLGCLVKPEQKDREVLFHVFVNGYKLAVITYKKPVKASSRPKIVYV